MTNSSDDYDDDNDELLFHCISFRFRFRQQQQQQLQHRQQQQHQLLYYKQQSTIEKTEAYAKTIL